MLVRVENLLFSYLCAGVSFVSVTIFSKRTFHLFQHPAQQLAIDHDDNGTTFDKHGPDKLGNFVPSGVSLFSEASSYMGNRTKVLRIPCPDIM